MEMSSAASNPWQTISALALPSLSVLYAIAVQCFNASNYEGSWFSLVTPISIRIAILGTTLGIIVPKGGIDNAYSFVAVVASGIWSLLLIYRIRIIHVNGPKPKISGSLSNKVIMVTGANAGIGRETVRQLVSLGATVIMACRNEKRAKEAMEDIIRSATPKNSDEEVRKRLIILQLDVSDMTSVRKAVQVFQDMKLPLHVLINNAGVIMGTRQTNSKGWEMTMAANHLGHFLLTNLLLPMMQQEEDARVIILTSTFYVMSEKGIDFDDFNCNNTKYNMFYRYSQSKLANILMGMELMRREKERVQNGQNDVKVFMVHPGLVRTDVVKNMPWYLQYPNKAFAIVLQTLQKTPEAGAYTSVFCATDKSIRSGDYFINSKSTALMQCGRDLKAAKDLWDLSRKLVELDHSD